MNNRPKRRKSKDNPYTLQVINNTYIVIFKDGASKEQMVEVSENVFNQLDQFELEDIRQMHKIDRHIEHIDLSDESINHRAINKLPSIEQLIEKKVSAEKLREAISHLSEKQKRRIIKYYFDGKGECEIAKEEKTSQPAIHYSIVLGMKKIKEISKKLKIDL